MVASRTSIVAFSILQNMRMRFRALFGHTRTTINTTPKHEAATETVARVRETFGDYLRYGRIASDAIQSKRVLEIGPGDHLGVALMFVAAGASQVVALDKFRAPADAARARALLDVLRTHLDAPARQHLDSAVAGKGPMAFDPDTLRYLPGHALETCPKTLDPGSFDYIVSRAALQEIHEIDAAFSAMDRLLRPGGVMVHRIDLRDYGMFSAAGMHPLTFLTIPEMVYRWMSTATRKPNRRLRTFYREKLAGWNYDVRILVTHLLGAERDLIPHKETLIPNVDYTEAQLDLIRQIRSQLRPEFRHCSNDELLTTGIVLVGRKPMERARERP